MNLERAIEITVNAHKGVTDKGGNPYILHPLKVMIYLKSDNEKIVGVLHDVVEDAGDWGFERLKKKVFVKRFWTVYGQSQKHLMKKIITNSSKEHSRTRLDEQLRLPIYVTIWM